MIFEHLRVTPFEPEFEGVATIKEAADMINKPHEDYPRYVQATEKVLRKAQVGNTILSSKLLSIHYLIFTDKSFAGRWRDINVYVGQHHPPKFDEVGEQMDELEDYYTGKLNGIKTLIEWYKDFETIHPFQDGNGRVGGVIVAVRSHELYPTKGWLAPNQ